MNKFMREQRYQIIHIYFENRLSIRALIDNFVIFMEHNRRGSFFV